MDAARPRHLDVTRSAAVDSKGPGLLLATLLQQHLLRGGAALPAQGLGRHEAGHVGVVGGGGGAAGGGQVGRPEAGHSALPSPPEGLLYQLGLAGRVDPPEGAFSRFLLGARHLDEVSGKTGVRMELLEANGARSAIGMLKTCMVYGGQLCTKDLNL